MDSKLETEPQILTFKRNKNTETIIKNYLKNNERDREKEQSKTRIESHPVG